MKSLQTLSQVTALGLALGFAGSANAALDAPLPYAVIDFGGMVTEYNSPPFFADQESRALGREFYFVVGVENWATVGSTLGVQKIDLQLPTIEVVATSDLLNVVEDIDDPILDPTFSNTLGEGTLTVINGVPVSVEYSIGREALTAWDAFFESRGFVDFGLKEVTIWGGGFQYLGEVSFADFGFPDIPGSFDYFSLATDNGTSFPAYGQSSVTVVPLPAAAWLFLSAIGLLGWRGRKQQS